MWLLYLIALVLGYILVGSVVAGIAKRVGYWSERDAGAGAFAVLIWPLCALLLSVHALVIGVSHVIDKVAGDK